MPRVLLLRMHGGHSKVLPEHSRAIQQDLPARQMLNPPIDRPLYCSSAILLVLVCG